MKLRLPRTLFRALVACVASFASLSLASASAPVGSMSFSAPDVEQTDSLLCWAASAADVLAAETGRDASSIYRSLAEAAGNVPGYVESALSWYMEGGDGKLSARCFDGRHTVSRHGFPSLGDLAAALQEAFTGARAVSAMLYACGEEQVGMGHAITVYACEYEGGRLHLRFADSADGVQGLRRAEVVQTERGLVLEGMDSVIASLAYLGEDADDVAPAAPVGGIMHSSPYLAEYTDMAENRGVYRFSYSPSLITYRNGEADYALAVTPDFSSVADMGCYTLLHNGSAQMTVEHNGIMNGSTYTARYVGEYAQKYSVAGIRGNATFTFGTNNPYVPTHDDYRIERMTRLVTDTTATAYCTDETLLSNMAGVTVYRVGAGVSGYYDTSGNYCNLAGAWGSGLTAGITSLMEQIFYVPETGIIGIQYHPADAGQTSAADPLPSVGLQGDSGSPVFIYNEEAGRMELVATLANADQTVWQAYYSPRATTAVDEYCTVTIASEVDYKADDAETTTLYLSGAKVGEEDELLEDGAAATYLRKGTISLGGETVATYNGVALGEFSQGTWKKLDADSLTWYTYTDNAYLNVASGKATDASTFGTDDLVYTSNLHFVANAAEGAATAYRRIELTEHVDLGIGHVQFSLGAGVTAATWDIGQSSSEYYLSSAGFVVDKGVTVNNYFTYEKGRELRRVGEGTMNLVGAGNSDVLLNIGGGGVTYLNRTDGHAAYSALVNSGAVLRLADVGQVYNNVTLGANGGVLDFNGNDYRWTSGGARSDGSFGLTVYEGLNRVETSVLANYAEGTSTTITIERAEDFEFAGAFRDGSTYTGGSSVEMDSRYTMMPSVLIGSYTQYSASDRKDSTSTLKVIYNGGATMSMTGVYTLLTGDSSFEVASGTVSLHGTNTIHAIGSETGTNTNRLQVADDWHYAMAEMNVKVNHGGAFVLGDHALLLGNVRVMEGGSFVMKQAVNARHEYVEGWVLAEDTCALADYYGLKGDVHLASGADMAIRFDEGVSTQLNYGGSISGSGSLTLDAGEGSVFLSGRNSVSGEKTVVSGNVRLASGAEGDTTTHKWLVGEKGSLALESVSSNEQLERLVDAASTGVLALTQDVAEQVSLSGLIVGAAEGETVHYGSSDTSLAPSGNQWTLGGGGGTLCVEFRLEGANKLVLGNQHGSGMVVLSNADNSFSGGIEYAGGVMLGYTDAGALGSKVVSVAYGRTLAAMGGAAFAGARVDSASDGIFALSGGTLAYDLSQHASLSLAACGEVTLTGALTVADGAAYRLGGAGVLTLATELSGSHGILIDGQGSTGSRVIFATASSDTGAVVVRGYDAAQASAGNVVLSFSADNALASAASVSLQNHAGIDLNGTNQRLSNLSGDANSLIVDGKGGNTLTLRYTQEATLASGVQAAGTTVVKEGSGTLTLSGENLWRGLVINEGVVKVSQAVSLGYLASGSQGIAVSVNDGGSLHLTQGMTVSNTFNIAGFGVDGASYALEADGLLNASLGTLHVTADAAISGQFSFKLLNLHGNSLSVKGSGSSLSASGMVDGTLSLTDGASLNLGNLNVGASVALELDNATVNVANGRFAGAVRVGAQGATICYPWNNYSTGAFNLTGAVSGTSAESTLHLVGYNHTINLSGGVELAGRVEVGNGLTLNITADASVGALINEANTGDLSRVVVNAATLEVTGSGNNFGCNGNPSTLSLTNGGQLQLIGLANGSSMGSLGTLNMGTDGVLALSSLAGYTGSDAMMEITSIEGTRTLQIDAAALSSLANGSTYHLLTSANELSGWTLLNNTVSGSRQTLTLVSGGEEGAYTLDLVVSGVIADASWKGSGTLTEGVEHANISSSAGDNTFKAMDSLTITSDAGREDTLTLGGTIHASSVSYTGAGKVTLAQENGGVFAAGLGVLVDGTGTLNLGSTKVISGEIELKQGTLAATTEALNAAAGLRVTGDATLELATASHVTSGIHIARDATMALTTYDGSMLAQWGGNLDGNLSGEGSLHLAIGAGRELHLNGDHSAFIGDVEVQSGTLQLGMREDNGVLLSSTLGARHLSLAQGTTLSLCSAATTLGADIVWAGGSTLHVKDGAENTTAYTFSGKQTLGGALTITSAASKTVLISGDVAGDSGSLLFTGDSTFILSGNNSYGGGTTLNSSGLTVYAGNANALGTGAIKLQQGTLAWTSVGNGWNGDLAASSLNVSGGVLNTNGYDVTYSGALSVSGTLTKSGAGTLVLTQNFAGSTAHVQEGTLALSLGKSSWYTGFSGEEGATLRLNSTSSYGTYLMGSMSGGMTVELQGDFAYAATNTHTGGTVLLSGSLDIGSVSALQSGSLHAHAGTTVTVCVTEALMAGDSFVDHLAFIDAASVAVGTDASAGHLSFNSLSGNASFLLDIFSAQSYDSLSGVLSAGSQLSVHLQAHELGSYLLVAGDNSGYDTSGITLTGTDETRYTYAWLNTKAGLTLNILDFATGSTNAWTGGTSGSWDNSSTSWNGNGSTFNSQVATLFCVDVDTSISVTQQVSTPTLTAEVHEGATLSFANNGGSITATTLQKDGAGTLTFASGSGNSFGSVVVNEGVLSISAADGNPLGTTSISGKGCLELTGGSLRADLNTGALAVENIRLDGGSLTLHSTAYWGTSISGRTVEIVGEDSSLSLEKWANLNASAIILRDGGILRTGENGLGNDGGTLYVDGAGTLACGSSGGGDVAASISGTGTLKVQDWNEGHWVALNGTIADDKNAAAPLALELSQNNVVLTSENSYSGGTTVTAGTVIVGNASALGSGALFMTDGCLMLETTFRGTSYSTDLSIGSLSGTGGEIWIGANELTIHQTSDGAYSGSITGTGAVTKTGAGSLQLSGSNSIGSVNLLEGRLVVASDGALGDAAVELSSDASLYVANGVTVDNTLIGASCTVGADARQEGTFSGAAAASLLSSGFTKEGEGLVAVVNSSGQNPSGAMLVRAGTLMYDAGSSTSLGSVSGSGIFALRGGVVNASDINVGKLEISNAVLAYSSTFDGKVIEVSGQGAELRMGHWASVNNSSLLLKDGGQLSMSSSGFHNSMVMVEDAGTLAVGETASKDETALLNVESTVTGSGTLHITDYGSLGYTVNLNREMADAEGGSLAVTTSQSDLHFTVANRYSGGTTINGGTAVAEVAGALGTGSVTLNGGELIARANGSLGSGDVTINGGKLSLDLGTEAQLFYMGNLSGMGGTVDVGQNIVVINQTEDGCYNGNVSGSGSASLIKRGDAQLELGGSLKSIDFQIDAGSLKLGDSAELAEGVLVQSVVTLNNGEFDINGRVSYNNALLFDVNSGYLAFRGDGDMLVKDSSGAATGLGFYTVYGDVAVSYRGTGRAEISANIVNGGQASPSNKMKFNVASANKGTEFTELTLSGDIGADHSANERYMFGIVKAGAGAMLLSGNNGYAGGTEVQAGTLIAASDTALGSGALSVSSGATLEIAAGRHLMLAGNISLADGSVLTLGSVDVATASLATSGEVSLGGALTLNISSTPGGSASYAVLSGASGLSSTGDITVNYSGDGRYSYTTRLDSTTLYLDAVQDAAADLVWNGTEADGVWNQSAQNANWNRADDAAAGSSFMNRDSVTFSDSAARKKVVVAEEGVQVESLSVSAEGYSFSGGEVQAESVTLEKAVEMAENASLNLGNAYTISQQDTSAAASIGPVEMGATSIRGLDGEKLATLDNALIDIAKGATLELKDLLMASSSRITDDPATVAMENVTIAVDATNATLASTTTLAAGTELLAMGGTSSIALPENASVITVFCSALDTVNVTGTSLTLDLSGYAANLGDAWQVHDYVAISFGQSADSLAHFDATGLKVSAVYGDSTYAVYVNLGEQTEASTLYISTTVAAVPEPTTATLSLLAFSLLAARRRRR